VPGTTATAFIAPLYRTPTEGRQGRLAPLVVLSSSRAAAVVGAALLALVAAAAMDRLALAPAADVGRGSEEAFARGLHRREIPPRLGPQRWTTGEAVVVFRDVPAGPAVLEVRLRGQQGPVIVAAGGVVVGSLDPGVGASTFALPDRGRGDVRIELRPPVFVAGDGRRLGALLDRVALRHAPARTPSARMVLLFVLPAVVTVAAGLAAGLSATSAASAAAVIVIAQGLLLWPCGLVRSGYALGLAAILALGSVLAGAFGAWMERIGRGRGRCAFGALLAAVLVQGVAATSPLMVVSDAVFHANQLGRVAAGDLFITSVTQHARPFRFPYGVSFYALLAPFLRAGLDAVWLVRAGAAGSGIAASAGLFALLAARGPATAALAVVLLQLLPGTFDVYSFGNLSNVFAQSMTALFFCWWADGRPGGWAAGGVLLALGALGHFSSLVVLAALCVALLLVRRRGPGADRAGALAVAAGLGLALLYYSSFWRLALDQLPRLLEGGGQGRGASRGAWDALRVQVVGFVEQWGIPALVLAVIGRPRPRRSLLDGDLAAYWIAGAALALPAVLTPIDVRYLYALTLPVAVAAAWGLAALSARGIAGRLLGALLFALQCALAARGILEAVLHRYRL
jgi:hypothetical protein